MRRVVAVVLALAASLTADPADAQPNVVVAVAAQFAPAEVVIAQGTGLTLVNADDMSHDLVALGGEFASAQIGRGETAEVVGVEALEPNTYDFYCTVHPDDMRGHLTVV